MAVISHLELWKIYKEGFSSPSKKDRYRIHYSLPNSRQIRCESIGLNMQRCVEQTNSWSCMFYFKYFYSLTGMSQTSRNHLIQYSIGMTVGNDEFSRYYCTYFALAQSLIINSSPCVAVSDNGAYSFEFASSSTRAVVATCGSLASNVPRIARIMLIQGLCTRLG